MSDTVRYGTTRRLRGMVRKEFLQILRDPSSIAIAFVLPVLLLNLFGYGVSLDARNIPLAVVIESPDSTTASLRGAFEQSNYFRPKIYLSIQAAEAALQAHRVQAIVWMQNDFTRKVLSGVQSPLAVRLYGVDANQARITAGYIQGVWGNWSAAQSQQNGLNVTPPAGIQPRVWFNAPVLSRYFLVPGVVALVMTLIGSMLTALVVAREWERGTMEALMVTPLAMKEMLAGKLIPYFLLGMGGMAFTVAMAVWQFQVPFRGSYLLLSLTGAMFLLVSLAIGLLISIVSKNQFVAGQIAVIVSFLPAFILSGFIFDIHSMPAAIQVVTYAVPARYFVDILKTLFLTGNVYPIIWMNFAALTLQLIFFTALVWRNSHKNLE